jgi:ABC-type transport system involved in cytochrome c biogenesis permease subunit
MNVRRLLALALFVVSVFGSEKAFAAPDHSVLEHVAIQDGGRKKPFYTFATETLQSLSGKASYKKADGSRSSAIEVMLSMWFKPEGWGEKPIILVNFKPLKEKLGLPLDRKLFSHNELSSNRELMKQMADLAAGEKQRKAERKTLNREQTEVRDVTSRLTMLHSLLSGRAFAFAPNPGEGDRWMTPDQAMSAYSGEKGKQLETTVEALEAAFKGLPATETAFASATQAFAKNLAQLRPEHYPTVKALTQEVSYNKLHPFRWAWILLAFAGIVLWVTSLWARNTGYQIAWLLVAGSFALQLYGFVARTLISGRAPVTNMYESVIWVAFGTVLLAMIMEGIYRSRVIFLSAIPVAITALILADTQTTILNPAIHPLTPVLRDNFWLSTHVTSITLSYAAFALALGVGHVVLGRVMLKREVSAALYNYLYRSLQIGVLLLATGTILGGVWANYSWGRFWDWDPKETWALIALLGYLAILHGRIAGWWKGFGLAVGSILGFQSVLMAWYGVNFVLGQGLHSYGFGTGGFSYVLSYVLAEIAFVAVAVWMKRRADAAKGTGAGTEAPSQVA